MPDVENNGMDVTGTANADDFFILEDLTIALELDGLGGIDTLRPLEFDPTLIGDLTTLTSIEQLAVSTPGVSTTIAVLGQLDKLVDYDNNFGGSIFLRETIRGSSATLDVEGLAQLTILGSDTAETLFLSTDFFSPTNMSIDGGGNNDTITTGGGTDALVGGDDNDTLDGGGGIDGLDGGQGNDTLKMRTGDSGDGGTENDTFLIVENLATGDLEGGSGTDRLDVDIFGNAVAIQAAVTIDSVEELALDGLATLTMTTDHLDGFSTILLGSNLAPSATLKLSQGGTAVTDVTGLTALTVNGATITALDDDDLTFTSTSTDITVNAGTGSDVIKTGDGDDTLNGGNDADTLDGGAGTDTLNGEAGIDTLQVRNGDSAFGGTENDVFVVKEDLLLGLTVLDGGEGTDTLRAAGVGARTLGNGVVLESIEQLRLDEGLLTLRADQLDDVTTIFEDGAAQEGQLAIVSSGTSITTNVTGLLSLVVTASAGVDDLTFLSTGFAATDITIDAGAENDDITTGVGNDTLRGQGGNDELNGGGGDDLLAGGIGTDTLVGDAGDDELRGQGGDDILLGGIGADDFRFGVDGDRDVILDFVDGEDQLIVGGFGVDFNTPEEIMALAVQVGANVEIPIPNPVSGTTTIVINNLITAQLDVGDFG